MRSLWTGSISFGLVNIPVRLYSASPEEKLNLDMLHTTDHSPIRYARVCKAEEREVPYTEIVKGYKMGDEYVVLDDADFKKANAKKTGSIDIQSFAKLDEIDCIYFEKPYYIEPDKSAKKAYALLHTALVKSGTVGIATFVLRNRERLAALKVHEHMLTLNQMRFASELAPLEKLSIPKDEKVSEKEVSMAMRLIDELTEPFRVEKYKDTYTDELRELIEKKARGEKVRPKGAAPKPTRVTDLSILLQRSLEAARK